jgi:ubiquitin C-terminal hydrolase
MLSNCLGFTHYFVSNAFHTFASPVRPEYSFLVSWLKTIAALFEKNQTIKPVSLSNSLQKYRPIFKKGKQHDAHECIINILDLIHASLVHQTPNAPEDNHIHKHLYNANKTFLEHFKDKWSVIPEMFFGQYIQKVKCTKCKFSSFSYQPFLGVSLSIPPTDAKRKFKTIYELLNFYFSTQRISKKCEHCSVSGDHTIKLRIIRLPKYLMINFKRFDNELNKRNDHIVYASDLDMSDYTAVISENTSYELISVINCYNGSLNTGHYTCINRTFDGEWVFIDDNVSTKVDTTSVCTKEAYILMYELNEF